MAAVVFALCENQYAAQHAAGIRLRNTLLHCFGLDPKAYIFSKTNEGKPYAVDAPFHFSISHSDALCCCAMSAEFPFSCETGDASLKMELYPCAPDCTVWEWTNGILFLPEVSGNIGIDIEKVDFGADLARLSKITKRYLHTTSVPTSIEDFYHSWTRQEALGKFTGEGFFTKTTTDAKLSSFRLNLEKQIYFLSIAYN